MTEAAISMTETVVSGMSKMEMLATAALVALIFVVAILAMNLIVSLKLAVFKGMREDVTEIKHKVKSGEELELIARDQVSEHERRYHMNGGNGRR